MYLINPMKIPPLIIACDKRNESMAKKLIEHGADVNAKNKYGGLPLTIACQENLENTIIYLVKFGADVNKNEKNSPLSNSCNKGNEKMVKFLLEHGANTNVLNHDNETPLMIA